MAWDIAWDKAMGSGEVPLITEIAEGTATAGDVPLGQTEIASRDSLPVQSWGNE